MWPTKQEAATALKISVKTLERLADKGTIRQRMRARPGASPIAVFNPEDIDREMSLRITKNGHPVILPAAAEPEIVPTPDSTRQVFLEGLELILSRVLSQQKQLPAPVELPHLITMEQAMNLGYPRRWLREQIQSGTLRKFGRSKISRFELERLAGRVDSVQAVQA